MTIEAAQATPQATPAPEAVGSKANPIKVEIPGAAARHESKAKATERVSRTSMVKALAGIRARGPDGKFVRATTETEPKPVDTEDPKPAEEQPRPAAEQKPAEQAKDAPKADPKVAEVESKLAQAIEREARYREGSRQASEKIADLSDEVEHWKSLFAAARATIRQHLKTDIDEGEIERRQLQLQLKRYQRGSKQQEEAQRQAQIGQLASTFKAKAASVIEKYPELNPQTSEDAKKWWAAWYRGDNKIEDMERDAEGAALLIRARQVKASQAAAAAQKPPEPEPRQRPESTIPQASAGTAPAKPVRPSEKVSTKAIVTHMKSFRAARGR